MLAHLLCCLYTRHKAHVRRNDDTCRVQRGAKTHKDADAILTLTPAQRVSSPRVRPHWQRRLFRLMGRLSLDLDLGGVWGGVCGLSTVHDAGRVSVLR